MTKKITKRKARETENIANAEEVEVAPDGTLVPFGSRKRKGIRPPAHTFY